MTTTAGPTSAAELTVAALTAAAREQTGLEDFGPPDFEQPLERFLDSATTETGLSPEGLVGLQMDVLRLLVNRLGFHHDLARHPDIRDEPITAPIVIVGMPRTGTTKLQRMMGADPMAQSAALWRLLFPVPAQDAPAGEPDPRIAMAQQYEDQLAEQAPEFKAVHAMVATEPEEEVLLAQMTFDRAGAFNWFYDTPSYHSWLADRPQDQAYSYLRGLLQYLQWQDGGARGRRWVLKSPVHTGNLETLLSTLPDATVVHCHREPTVALASFCRLLEIIRATRGHAPDRAGIGRFSLALHAGELQRNLEQRDRIDAPGRLLDVRFEDICADAGAVISRIHAASGPEPSQSSRDAMLEWDRANAPDRFGVNRYALEDYGLGEGEVREAFAPYRERFGYD